MPAPVLILTPGTEVRIGGAGGTNRRTIEAVIDHAHVFRGGHVTYTVVWWDGKARKVETLDAAEVTPADPNAETQVGFAPERV